MTLAWRTLLELAAVRFGWTGEDDIDGLDPYLVWADATAFAGCGQVPVAGPYPFLIEFELAAGAGAGIAATPAFQALQAGLQIPPAYLPLLQRRQASITALVAPGTVRSLRDSGALAIRAQMALPRIPRYCAAPAAQPPAPAALTIAVIDDGLPFAHAQFRTWDGKAWHTRVEFVWDQGRDAAGQWQPVAGLAYGRELARAGIDALLAAHTGAGGVVDEDALYAAADYQPARLRSSHGAVVADIAAGAPDPLRPRGAPADAAGAAAIVFVQLPRTAVEDFAAGALQAFVLDALRYIDLRTTAADGSGKPVAINLSYGTFAGPHDGSSLLDAAIDDFLAARADCALVIAAGNARSARAHACVEASQGGRAQLRWVVSPDDATDSFLELWIAPQGGDGAPPQVAVRLLPPGDAGCAPVGSNASCFGCSPQGTPLCAVIHPAHAATGRNGAMVLLAVAPTRPLAGRPEVAPAGTWVVDIRNDGAPVEIHAWIERDDGSLDGGGKQSRFEAGSAAISERNTLGSFSHAGRAIVVGGCIDDAATGRPAAPYSGCGPGRLAGGRGGPDVVAGSEQSLTLAGLRAAACRSGDTVRLGGTSVAAPVVVRAVANQVLHGNSGQGSAAIKRALLDRATPRQPSEDGSCLGEGRFKSLVD